LPLSISLGEDISETLNNTRALSLIAAGKNRSAGDDCKGAERANAQFIDRSRFDPTLSRPELLHNLGFGQYATGQINYRPIGG